MSSSLTTYLLAGALAASLAWNLRASFTGETRCSEDSACGTGGSCASALEMLDLDEEQRAALADWSKNACTQSVASEQRAKELAGELHTLLAAHEFDADRALGLADEIGRLRGQALRDCIKSVVAVRRVLTPQQLHELLGKCCGPTRQ